MAHPRGAQRYGNDQHRAREHQKCRIPHARYPVGCGVRLLYLPPLFPRVSVPPVPLGGTDKPPLAKHTQYPLFDSPGRTRTRSHQKRYVYATKRRSNPQVPRKLICTGKRKERLNTSRSFLILTTHTSFSIFFKI